MATYTTNFNLEKPDASDEFGDFRTSYNSNMDIIDQNLGGGGGSSTLAGLTDVSITTPVTGDALIYDGAEWANTPLSAVATTGDYGDLLNTPSLATVATSGSYTDLSNKPTIPTALSDLSDDSTHRVVTDTQISTWNGKSDFSGSYNDLTDKPTIPTVNDGTLTIQQNGTTVGTFTANQSGNTTVNLSGGGGSAHTIVNESGTALADEPNLQFTDGLTATDDSVNTKTKVGVDTTFTESATRTNIASGDSLATIFGKIKKWFSDLPSMFVSKSGDTMTGKLTLSSSGLEYPQLAGYIADGYGDLKHKRNNTSDYLGIKSYDESTTLKYYWETGKLAVSGDVSAMGTVLLGAENNVCFNLRPSSSNWCDTVSVQTGGDEAVVFASKNTATSWLFVSGEDSITNHGQTRWQSLTPGLQIKNNCVSIGKLIPSGTYPSYELEVGGRAKFDFGNTFITTVQIGGSVSNGMVVIYNGNEGDLSANSLSAIRSWKLPDKNGTIAMTSDISSRRFKENILPMTDDECEKILDVDVITFDYKAESNVVGENERVGNRGVIAEDVAELIPTAVEYEELDGEQVPYGVNYTKFIPYLIKMVQIQQKEINELKSMLADKEN